MRVASTLKGGTPMRKSRIFAWISVLGKTITWVVVAAGSALALCFLLTKLAVALWGSPLQTTEGQRESGWLVPVEELRMQLPLVDAYATMLRGSGPHALTPLLAERMPYFEEYAKTDFVVLHNGPEDYKQARDEVVAQRRPGMIRLNETSVQLMSLALPSMIEKFGMPKMEVWFEHGATQNVFEQPTFSTKGNVITFQLSSKEKLDEIDIVRLRFQRPDAAHDAWLDIWPDNFSGFPYGMAIRDWADPLTGYGC